jgi:putative ABC transport system permease protein
MSYAVGRRTHELGVRMALGPSRQTVLSLVLRQGMTLAASGAIVGLAGALVLTRFMAGLLFGVRPTDPWTLGAVALLLGGIALAACCVPAVRAAKVDPMVALRYE